MNLRFPNAIERDLTPSLMRKDLYQIFEEKYKPAFYQLPHSDEEVKKYNESYDDLMTFLELE